MATAFYTYNKNKIIEEQENAEIVHLATEYIKKLIKNNVLRIYSLNYDRVMQAVFQEAGVKVFQGFIPDDIVPKEGNQSQYPDTKRILTSFDEHCIYHLHGNIYWKPDNVNPNGLDGYSFHNVYFPLILSNNGHQHFTTEKNKPLFLSNIITGYSKVQRTNLTPFKQMASAFDIDCHTADEIVIVGYSFGDDHINDTIRQAKKANPLLKIIIITPASSKECQKHWQRKVLFEILSHIASIKDFVFENQLNSVHSKQYYTTIYFQTWKEYMVSNLQSHP
ncbi:SIR2 family protein [Sphingobacterium wenxiniae]|uniref:SIR2-like domain-containing protein n=1 Tax=Sphingobacterium wenxiniae TaxID=683125 RepID=A0A1I6NYR5_9SPHI|nr:SIR2 family protein [Sphingobacterium wenxiniae]SFS32980.1 SIR2-like domain-containing protein [Sphingobacterium wenxiniae]